MHVRATRRATDACQIGKERVLSAGLSVQIQSDAFATERSLKYELKVWQKGRVPNLLRVCGFNESLHIN